MLYRARLLHASFTPGLQLQRQLNYIKCLVALLPGVVPNAQNRTLKKRKLDSNPRYGPDVTDYYAPTTPFLEPLSKVVATFRWKTRHLFGCVFIDM